MQALFLLFVGYNFKTKWTLKNSHHEATVFTGSVVITLAFHAGSRSSEPPLER